MLEIPILNCDNCGACCRDIGTPPFLPHEIISLPLDLQDEIERYRRREPKREWSKKPCFWLDEDTMRCLHYEHRPYVCQEFEMGSDSCRGYRNYYRVSGE